MNAILDLSLDLPIALAVRVRYAAGKNLTTGEACRALLEKVNAPRAVSRAQKGECTRAARIRATQVAAAEVPA